MRAVILSILLLFSYDLLAENQSIQKVAQYSIAERGSKHFELFSFYPKTANQAAKIEYSYGKYAEQYIPLSYLGETKVNGQPAFKVKFPNGYRLTIIPQKDLSLIIKDKQGKYNKHFKWMYEGPVNGVGTYCSSCAQDEKEAMQILVNDFLGIKARMNHGSLEWL